MPTTSFPEIEQWQGVASATEVRPVLLLMAYECMPDSESEAYAGWERVLQASREFDVHVIVSAESLSAIERHGHTHTLPGVRFHTPKPDPLYRVLQRAPNLFKHNNIAYYYWQHLAYRLARELHRRHCFSLVHQINASTFREPGYTWRLGIPYVWGPMGGTQNFPVAFLPGMPLAEQIAERAHNISNAVSLRRRRIKTAAKRASVLLAANSVNKSDFERAFRRRVELLPVAAIDAVRRPETARFRERGPLNILWSGEPATRKALPLLLEALANLGHDVEYHLHILGDGPIDMEREALATELGVVRRCTFLGDCRTADVIAQLDWAHLFVSTGLRDTSDKLILEALAHGVPVMCFGQQSADDIVTPACGIRIPLTHPGHAIAAMASSIRSLAQDRSRLLQLSAGACDRARNYLWSENAARITSIYRSLVLAGAQNRAAL